MNLPGAHILQTWEWGQVKARYGWNPQPLILRDQKGQVCAAALMLSRQMRIAGVSLPSRIIYIPRGPLLDWSEPILRDRLIGQLEMISRQPDVLFVKIDPEVVVGSGIPGSEDELANPDGMLVQEELLRRGWIFSQDQIQFRNTVLLDLSGNPDDWLALMKQKTRYNLRLAERKGISVRSATLADLSWYYQAYAETSVRDGFVIRSQEYYLHVWKSFFQQGLAEGLIAEYEGESVAGLIQFRFGKRAWYLYGMSRNIHREKMPNYLLQWIAMIRAKGYGCEVYDLWGAPDVFDGADEMDGVLRFKIGLGGKITRTIGAWDFTTKPIAYRLYTRLLPQILSLMRSRRKEETRQEVSL